MEFPDRPEGRQLLDVFRIEGHVPFEAEHVKELQELIREFSGELGRLP